MSRAAARGLRAACLGAALASVFATSCSVGAAIGEDTATTSAPGGAQQPSAVFSPAASEELLRNARDVLSAHGVEGWSDLQGPDFGRCDLPGQTDLTGTNVYHSIQADALADAEWPAAKQELVDLSAADGLTDVASLIDRDGTHFLDIGGPGGAILSVRLTPGNAAVAVTSACTPNTRPGGR